MKFSRALSTGLAAGLLSLLTFLLWLDAPEENRSATSRPALEPDAGSGPGQMEFPDRFDRRRPAGDAATAEQRAAAERLRARVPGVAVHHDPLSRAPGFVASPYGFLTGPQGRGLAMPEAAPVREDGHELVKAFLDEYADLFRHGGAVLAEAKVTRDYVTAHNGVRTMVWQQEHKGRRVFGAHLMAHVTRSAELINTASLFLPDPDFAEIRGGSGEAVVSAQEAVAASARALGSALDVKAVSILSGEDAMLRLEARPELRDVTAELVWLPEDGETLRLCWEVEAVSSRTGFLYRSLVDAENGDVRLRQCLTEAVSDASFRVFTGSSAQPLLPSLETPLITEPPLSQRELLTLSALNPVASPDGWIADGINETRGNNVDAHLDTNADNVADTPRPQGSPARTFSPTFNPLLAPSSNASAGVVNLFYWCNVAHDRLYDLGFTEAAGNFQVNNFGRGGAGNDAVQADSLDGRGTNNAYFSTPADGSPGRMEMLVYTGPHPDRDSSLDTQIVLHEYAHGLTNRLVGGGAGISANIPRAMGEGWSDFYALCLISRPEHPADAPHAMSGYTARLRGTGFLTEHYFGVRRYPYSTDQRRNPLQFRDVSAFQAQFYAVPINPTVSNTAESTHNMGEFWCSLLWDARAHLIARHGATAGNDLILRLVTDGLKLSPANPGWTAARDAILQADLAYTGGANRGELWTAFALRGLGSNAVGSATDSNNFISPGYAVPDALSVTTQPEWTPTVSLGGGAGNNSYTLQNTSGATCNWSASPLVPWLSASPSSGTLAAGASVTVTVSLTAGTSSLPAGEHAGRIEFMNAATNFRQPRVVRLAVTTPVLPFFEETWESGAISSVWSITGTGSHRTLNTSLNGPAGGFRHLTMDASTATASRNEATLTLDLTGRQGVMLGFRGRSFSDEAHGPPAAPFTGSADFDGVAISADGGTTWYEVQPLRDFGSGYQQVRVDLDAAAGARGLSYGPNFKIRFTHHDDGAIPGDGFGLDDIQLYEMHTTRLVLDLAAETTEGDAALNGTIRALPVPTTPLTVTLAVSATDQLAVPVTVTIPAGSSSATFTAAAVEDALLDGSQRVQLTASSPGYAPASGYVAVHDNEAAVLSLAVPAVMEGLAGQTGTVSMSAPAEGNVTVRLTSADPAVLTVPGEVVIPAGQSSAVFSVSSTENSVIHFSRTVELTAAVTNWTAASAAVTVTDNESTALTLNLPASIREGGYGNGTVQLSGSVLEPLTVNFSVDVPELRINNYLAPLFQVEVPAGQTSAPFYLETVDDLLRDGSVSVQITATAPPFSAVTAACTVHDNDAASFVISNIPSPRIPNVAIGIIATAWDIHGVQIPNYNRALRLSATAGGQPLTVTPTTQSAWNASGLLQGSATITTIAHDVVFTLDDLNGVTAQSNAFDTAIGPPSRIAWDPIPSPRRPDEPFAVRLRTVDQGSNPVTTFQGTATILSWVNSAAGPPVLPQGPVTFSDGVWIGNVTMPFTHSSLLLRAVADGFAGLSPAFAVTTPVPPAGIADFTLTAPSFLLEGGGALDGVLTLPAPAEQETTFTLTSSAPGEFTVPADVTVPTGQSSVTFPLTPLDDPWSDGDKPGFVIATPPAGAAASASLTVLDNEIASFNFTAPAALTEGGSTGTATVTLSSAPAFGSVILSVASSDPSQLTVPATVTIPTGQTTATFALTPVNDALVDGVVPVNVTVTRAGSAPVIRSVQVNDDEPRSVYLGTSGHLTVDEGGTFTVPVRAWGTLIAPLTVNITSSNPARLLPPASVVIPAGASSASVEVTAPENAVAGEAVSVTLTLVPEQGFTGGNASWTVHENDPATFLIIASATRTKGEPANQIIWARTPTGQTPQAFHAAAVLSAAGDVGSVPLTPQTTAPFAAGRWSGPITYLAPGRNVRLTAAFGSVSGTGTPFDVMGAPAVRHEVSLPPGPIRVGEPASITVTPYDAEGLVTNNTSAGVSITATQPYTEYMPPGAAPAPLAVQGTLLRSRTRCLYTPAETGGAQRMTGLALNFVSVPASGPWNWVIRLKHSPLSVPAPLWDNDGWTIVVTSFNGIASPGWVSFPFTKEFYYNGTDNLLVEFSFDHEVTPRTDGAILCGAVSGRCITGGSDNILCPPPLQWTGPGGGLVPAPEAVNLLPAMRFLTAVPLTAFYLEGSAFANGAWTSGLSFTGPGRNVRITVAGSQSSQSPAFDILPSASSNLRITVEQNGTFSTARGTVPVQARIWRLFNTGGIPLTWQATSTVSWAAIDQTDGVLGPLQSTLVSLVPHSGAAALASGVYPGNVAFDTLPASISTNYPLSLTVNPGGVLTVSGPAPDFFAGTAGGPFSRQAGPGASWTSVNTGDAALNWTAVPGSDWLSLSPAAGTLAAAGSAPITASATSAATLLGPGEYRAASAITNASTGVGSTARETRLHVTPRIVFDTPLPAFSGGATHIVSARPDGPGMEYELETDSAAAFTAPQSSGWTSAADWSFSGIPHGALRHYRVRSRTARSLGLWSQSTPAALGNSAASGTVADATGFILESSAGGLLSSVIQNPGFESGTSTASLPSGTLPGWTREQSTWRIPAVRSYPSGGLPAQGVNAMTFSLYPHGSPAFVAGDYSMVSQRIDFRGASDLIFDAVTMSPWTSDVQASVRIDGTPVWTRAMAGLWLNETIPLSNWQGSHTLELRFECLNGGALPQHTFQLDRLRFAAPAGYAARGTLTSPVITAPQPGAWAQLFMDAETPPGTEITAELLSGGATIATGLTSGADLSALPQLQNVSALQIRAGLATTQAQSTPRLRSWGMTWLTPGAGPLLTGAWSEPISSTRDAEPPQIILTSAVAAATATHVLTGTTADLSGISSLSINGIPVSSADSYATWSLPVVLAPGTNEFTLTAADRAVPPNLTTLPFTVTHGTDSDGDRLPDDWETAGGLNPASSLGDEGTQGDPDGDGLTNFIELALGLSPHVHDAGAAPRVEIQPGPGGAGTELALVYRRRTAPGFTFLPQISTDLAVWTPGAVEQISAEPAGDGLTETVTVRILPGLPGGPSRLCIRVHVTAP